METIFSSGIPTLLLTIGSLGVIVWKVFSYMTSRDSCMTMLKEEIKETKDNINDLRDKLQSELSISRTTHKEITQRINSIDQNLHLIMGKLETLHGK